MEGMSRCRDAVGGAGEGGFTHRNPTLLGSCTASLSLYTAIFFT